MVGRTHRAKKCAETHVRKRIDFRLRAFKGFKKAPGLQQKYQLFECSFWWNGSGTSLRATFVRDFCRSENLRGARGQALRCKNTVKWGYILIPQCTASSTSWVPATTKVYKQNLLAVRFPTHSCKNYTRTTGTFVGNRVPC